jgi:hypothetical protein
MKRIVVGAIVASVSLALLLAAMVLLLASVFLAFAGVVAPWAAAFATALVSVTVAVLLVGLATRKTTPRTHGENHYSSATATQLVRKFPMGAAGTALTAGVLISSSRRTRNALIKSVDTYVRAVHTDM